MLELLITWHYSFFGTFSTYGSKVTIAAQYILLYLLVFVGIAAFLGEIESARDQHKRYILLALRNWWPVYEALMFPILVLLPSPYYFMVIIGLGHLFVFYNAFHVEKYRWLAILKSCYPIVLHGCFVVFMFFKTNRILANTSIVYLFILIVGSMHHLFEEAFYALRGLYHFLKKMCKGNKIKPIHKEKKL